MHAALVQRYHMMITWFLQTTLWNPYSQLLSTVSIIQQWQQLDDIYQCRALEVERKFRDGGIIAKSKVIILASDKEGGKEWLGSFLWGELGEEEVQTGGRMVGQWPGIPETHRDTCDGHRDTCDQILLFCPFSSNLPSSLNNTSFNRICNSSTF